MGNQPHKLLARRVTTVAPNSPATDSELNSYTDFIIGVMGCPPEFNLATDFFRFLVDNEGKEVKLMVFSLLSGIQRIVILTPSRDWPDSDGVSGFKSRIENIRHAQTNTFRISGVKNEDLKDIIKLNSDFFLGIEEIIFKDLQDLKDKLAFMSKCHVIVYSVDTQQVQHLPVNCTNGLGLEFSTGMLHQLSSIYQKSVLVGLQKAKLKEAYGDLDDAPQDEVVVFQDGQRVDVEQLMANLTHQDGGDAGDVPSLLMETSNQPAMANKSSDPSSNVTDAHIPL